MKSFAGTLFLVVDACQSMTMLAFVIAFMVPAVTDANDFHVGALKRLL
jgi:hypothetical protein